eukprot:scaffold301335_cov27-Prasinocladus_malaysianus.AAC.2
MPSAQSTDVRAAISYYDNTAPMPVCVYAYLLKRLFRPNRLLVLMLPLPQPLEHTYQPTPIYNSGPKPISALTA